MERHRTITTNNNNNNSRNVDFSVPGDLICPCGKGSVMCPPNLLPLEAHVDSRSGPGSWLSSMTRNPLSFLPSPVMSRAAGLYGRSH